jgi:hypothetical protein
LKLFIGIILGFILRVALVEIAEITQQLRWDRCRVNNSHETCFDLVFKTNKSLLESIALYQPALWKLFEESK